MQRFFFFLCPHSFFRITCAMSTENSVSKWVHTQKPSMLLIPVSALAAAAHCRNVSNPECKEGISPAFGIKICLPITAQDKDLNQELVKQDDTLQWAHWVEVRQLNVQSESFTAWIAPLSVVLLTFRSSWSVSSENYPIAFPVSSISIQFENLSQSACAQE